MLQRFQSFLWAVLLLAAASGTACAQSGWVRIATQTFDTSGEIAGFALDSAASGTAIRLEAKNGDVVLEAVVVTLGQGRVHVEERKINLKTGERTRPIQLSATNEPVRSVEVVLAPGGKGKATLEVWALTAPGATAAARPAGPTPTTSPTPKPAPALTKDPVTGEYRIGKTKLGGLGYDHEAVPVGDNAGLKTITLEAKDRGVTLDSVNVTYKDGTKDTVPVRTRLDPGQKQKLDIPSAKPVSNIAIKARSRIFDQAAKGTGSSSIEITGQPVVEPVPSSATGAEAAKPKNPPAAKAEREQTRPYIAVPPGTNLPIGGSQAKRGIGGSSGGRGGAGGSGGSAGYPSLIEGLDACVKDKSCTAVPVFFGTDRDQAATPTGRISFGTERAGRVQLGRVFVTVPSKNRAAGELNIPGTLDWIRGTPEGGDPKRHFTIPASGITLFKSEDELIAAVKDHVASGNGTHKDHAFVYVHGYRTPWEFAAMRTAQIAYDLSPDDAPFGTPFLYSWPSQGAAAEYITDLENSRIAIPHLTKFLRMVVERTGASHVHVIAHSMGNFPVIHALAKLAEEMPGKHFSEVILAAPDVEKKEFEEVAPAGLVKIARGVTLYASSSDIALLLSRLVRRDKPRAGDAKDPPGPAIIAGIDTVDISRLSTGFMSYLSWNHDKYADSPVLLNDMSTLFRTGERRAPPNERNIRFRLQQSPAIQAGFWRYSE